MAQTSTKAPMDKVRPSNASNSDSDSEDDDFVPAETVEPSQSVASTSRASTKEKKRREDRESDADSDAEQSDDEAEGAWTREEIDVDELEALKREREELVAAAGGEDRLGKRRRLAQNTNTTNPVSISAGEEATALKAKALAEWDAIKASEAGPSADGPVLSTSSAPHEVQGGTSAASVGEEEMVSISTTYKFAGEVHSSIRVLPRSHPDAIKHLSQTTAKPTSPNSSSTSNPSTSAIWNDEAATRRPPPGPRRKKVSSLAAMSAAATVKPTKLNTLEKSKLDWDTFKGSSAQLSRLELDELENQTRGGGKGLGDMKGYLDRRDFLDRVKDRTGQS